MKKVLYCGLLYDYGVKDQGYSYEYYNIEQGFRDCLERGQLFDRVDFYYPDSIQESTLNVLENIRNGVYDYIFHVAFNDTFDLPLEFAELALSKSIPVIQWDCDASYRFSDWILPRKNRVSHFITTHNKTLEWYRANDMTVVKSQWGGSPLYTKQELPKIYDSVFIGQCHGHFQDGTGRMLRRSIMDDMASNGVPVKVWGKYWGDYSWHNGLAADIDEMCQIMNQAKIGLNLLNGWAYSQLGQIKGRCFEIPQTGLLQLTTPADDLVTYFEPGKEIIIVNTMDEMIGETKRLLADNKAREKIALAGYLRMHAEHQWHHRLTKIFEAI